MTDEPTITDRGFKHMPPIPGTYGGEVQVYESSSADHPHIWLKVSGPDTDPDESIPTGTVHLSVGDAERHIAHVRFLIDNHYHRQGGIEDRVCGALAFGGVDNGYAAHTCIREADHAGSCHDETHQWVSGRHPRVHPRQPVAKVFAPGPGHRPWGHPDEPPDSPNPYCDCTGCVAWFGGTPDEREAAALAAGTIKPWPPGYEPLRHNHDARGTYAGCPACGTADLVGVCPHAVPLTADFFCPECEEDSRG